MPGSARTAVAALLFGLSCGSHAAASQICDQLGFELANLSDQADPVEEVDKYARAIVAQKRGLQELDLTMRKTGCSSGSVAVVGGPNAGECSHLEAKKSRMERNLEILQNKRISLMSESAAGNNRQKLVAALTENRCNEQPTLVSTPGEDGSPSLVRDDPDGFETIRVPSTETSYNGSQFVDLGGAAMTGNYRTMCVRTCDGGYFPVSSHASPMSFRRDAQVCSMMCPGTETELYYHSLEAESTDMRSTSTGRPYQDLPNAYLFRTEKPGSKPECGCNFALYYKEMMKRQSYVANPDSLPEKQSSIVWLKPALRPSLKKADEVAAIEPKRKERDYVENSHIRIVGPQFLPDKGIDFTKPIGDQTK
jgi:hypothetical protein